MVGLFDYNLFIPKQTGKQLELLADELNFYLRRNMDVHELGGAVLMEFIKIHRQESYKEIARIISGARRIDVEEEPPTIKFFRS